MSQLKLKTVRIPNIKKRDQPGLALGGIFYRSAP
jgi:hypothetical protein